MSWLKYIIIIAFVSVIFLGDYWLDGIDDVHETEWRWASTYSIIEPTFWYPGQPDNTYGNEDCLEVNIGDRGLWNDDNCDKHQFCICEKSLPNK